MKLNPRLLNAARPVELILLASISLGLLGGILGIYQARQVSNAINQVFLEHKPLDGVILVLLLILVLIILRLSFSWGGEICGTIAAQRIKQDLRHRLISHIMQLGPAYLRSEAGEAQVRTGELVNTAVEGIDALEVYFSQYLPQIALAALIPVAILLYVFPIDPLSGMIFLITAPLLPLFMYLIGSAAEALTRKQWLGLSRMSAYFLDILQGLTTLKCLGRSRDQIEVIRKVSDNYRQTTMHVLRVTFLSALVLELVATLCTAVVAVEIGIRLLYGKLVFEQAFFLLLLAPEFYQPLRLLATRFHAGMAGVEAAKRIFDILDLPTNRPAQAVEPSGEIEKLPPSISFIDVGYAYSNGNHSLQGITLEIPPGKMTALAGESGAGKTTLTWLLLGFLRPQAGQILVDGKSLADIPYDQWLEKLAWVPQNPYLFNDTISANIALAKPGASDEEIIEAARQANADGFIQSLPMRYQTQIGEHGVRLSAGQAQRIALARAFLKNAPLLILDEATSHLDPQSDRLIRSCMQRLYAGRTVLVIAHRQNTLAMAGQVVRMSHGKVIQITHQTHPSPPILPGNQPQLLDPHPLPVKSSQKAAFPPLMSSTIPADKSRVERRLIKLLAPYAGHVALSVLLGFATVASAMGLMATAAYIISAAALHPSIAELQVAIVGVRFFGLTRGLFRYLDRLVSHDTTLRLLAGWRLWFFQALEPLAPARLMSYHSGDLLSRIISDVNTLENFYIRSIAPPLVALSVSIAAALILGGFGLPLAWGLLVFIFLAGIGLPWLSMKISRRLGPAITAERARLTTLLVDGFQGMADIISCGQASVYIERIRQSSELLNRTQSRLSLLNATQTALSNLLGNLGMLAVLTLGIQRVAQGQLDGVLLGVVTLVALTCFEALQPLPQAAQSYATNRAAASRLYELVDSSPAVSEASDPLPLPNDFNFEVKDLAFQYPLSETMATGSSVDPFSLQDISFSLPQGKHIALIGPSGAGKTTIINLLLRFWEYTHGSILFNQHELRRFRAEDLRRCMALISQNTYLFSASLKDNLLIARPDATSEEIVRATSQAQLHEFIQSLPDGFDTWIGEHGFRLSAGERQRLAVARALLMHTPIIFLDEPTANLDQSTAQALMDTIREITRGVSTITITQSMLGLETMDEILVLEGGRIIEHGDHEQLLAFHGNYKRMWELYYREVSVN
jgi:ATP-binding cassette subfamily C protein CydCD